MFVWYSSLTVCVCGTETTGFVARVIFAKVRMITYVTDTTLPLLSVGAALYVLCKWLCTSVVAYVPWCVCARLMSCHVMSVHSGAAMGGSGLESLCGYFIIERAVVDTTRGLLSSAEVRTGLLIDIRPIIYV